MLEFSQSPDSNPWTLVTRPISMSSKKVDSKAVPVSPAPRSIGELTRAGAAPRRLSNAGSDIIGSALPKPAVAAASTALPAVVNAPPRKTFDKIGQDLFNVPRSIVPSPDYFALPKSLSQRPSIFASHNPMANANPAQSSAPTIPIAAPLLPSAFALPAKSNSASLPTSTASSTATSASSSKATSPTLSAKSEDKELPIPPISSIMPAPQPVTVAPTPAPVPLLESAEIPLESSPASSPLVGSDLNVQPQIDEYPSVDQQPVISIPLKLSPVRAESPIIVLPAVVDPPLHRESTTVSSVASSVSSAPESELRMSIEEESELVQLSSMTLSELYPTNMDFEGKPVNVADSDMRLSLKTCREKLKQLGQVRGWSDELQQRTVQLQRCEQLLVEGYRLFLQWSTLSGVPMGDEMNHRPMTASPSLDTARSEYIDTVAREQQELRRQKIVRFNAEICRMKQRQADMAAAASARRANPIWLDMPAADIEKELEDYMSEVADTEPSMFDLAASSDAFSRPQSAKVQATRIKMEAFRVKARLMNLDFATVPEFPDTPPHVSDVIGRASSESVIPAFLRASVDDFSAVKLNRPISALDRSLFDSTLPKQGLSLPLANVAQLGNSLFGARPLSGMISTRKSVDGNLQHHHFSQHHSSAVSARDDTMTEWNEMFPESSSCEVSRENSPRTALPVTDVNKPTISEVDRTSKHAQVLSEFWTSGVLSSGRDSSLRRSLSLNQNQFSASLGSVGDVLAGVERTQIDLSFQNLAAANMQSLLVQAAQQLDRFTESPAPIAEMASARLSLTIKRLGSMDRSTPIPVHHDLEQSLTLNLQLAADLVRCSSADSISSSGDSELAEALRTIRGSGLKLEAGEFANEISSLDVWPVMPSYLPPAAVEGDSQESDDLVASFENSFSPAFSLSVQPTPRRDDPSPTLFRSAGLVLSITSHSRPTSAREHAWKPDSEYQSASQTNSPHLGPLPASAFLTGFVPSAPQSLNSTLRSSIPSTIVSRSNSRPASALRSHRFLSTDVFRTIEACVTNAFSNLSRPISATSAARPDSAVGGSNSLSSTINSLADELSALQVQSLDLDDDSIQTIKLTTVALEAELDDLQSADLESAVDQDAQFSEPVLPSARFKLPLPSKSPALDDWSLSGTPRSSRPATSVGPRVSHQHPALRLLRVRSNLATGLSSALSKASARLGLPKVEKSAVISAWTPHDVNQLDQIEAYELEHRVSNKRNDVLVNAANRQLPSLFSPSQDAAHARAIASAFSVPSSVPQQTPLHGRRSRPDSSNSQTLLSPTSPSAESEFIPTRSARLRSGQRRDSSSAVADFIAPNSDPRPRERRALSDGTLMLSPGTVAKLPDLFVSGTALAQPDRPQTSNSVDVVAKTSARVLSANRLSASSSALQLSPVRTSSAKPSRPEPAPSTVVAPTEPSAVAIASDSPLTIRPVSAAPMASGLARLGVKRRQASQVPTPPINPIVSPQPEPPFQSPLSTARSALRNSVARLENELGASSVGEGAISIVRLLGTGAFGRVYLARIAGLTDQSNDVDSHQLVAIKRLIMNGSHDSLLRLLVSEVGMLRSLRHANIVQFLGIFRSANGKDPDTYNIVLEYVDGGSLLHLLQSCGGKFDERYAAGIVLQILDGLAYLHSCTVIHRDIKLANILVSETVPLSQGRRSMPSVKISDFGTAVRVCEAQAMRRSCVGTPWFLAPEVIQVEEYSFPADIWSVGCCLFNMVTGRRPFHECNAMQCIYRMVTEEHPPFPDDCTISAECRDFIMSCWRRDWRTRPSAVELMEHPFILNNMRM